MDQVKPSTNHPLEVATLGSGCFWCTEAVFDQLKGVEKVESGYSGGSKPSPSYREVCSGTTGHAETVQVTFDPGVITYGDILHIFFTTHDPTTLNRQGADVGTQYRSVIFYHNDKQRETAQQVISELAGAKIWKNPIITEVVPFKAFYKAEDYHQEFYRNNRDYPYCQVVIEPKIMKLRQNYLSKMKTVKAPVETEA
ncbi:MAG TPA: peptide-methionine (S)-S-oxide reductase MsrA [Candidatus Binatus sp.]|nr:peptide-methionine (S)-S-oxide reductase MsrA [Candidatus Binatus sp.]